MTLFVTISSCRRNHLPLLFVHNLVVDRRHPAEMLSGFEHVACLVEVSAHADGTVVTALAFHTVDKTDTCEDNGTPSNLRKCKSCLHTLFLKFINNLVVNSCNIAKVLNRSKQISTLIIVSAHANGAIISVATVYTFLKIATSDCPHFLHNKRLIQKPMHVMLVAISQYDATKPWTWMIVSSHI